MLESQYLTKNEDKTLITRRSQVRILPPLFSKSCRDRHLCLSLFLLDEATVAEIAESSIVSLAGTGYGPVNPERPLDISDSYDLGSKVF
jgi:hypothetical protein